MVISLAATERDLSGIATDLHYLAGRVGCAAVSRRLRDVADGLNEVLLEMRVLKGASDSVLGWGVTTPFNPSQYQYNPTDDPKAPGG